MELLWILKIIFIHFWINFKTLQDITSHKTPSLVAKLEGAGRSVQDQAQSRKGADWEKNERKSALRTPNVLLKTARGRRGFAYCEWGCSDTLKN